MCQYFGAKLYMVRPNKHFQRTTELNPITSKSVICWQRRCFACLFVSEINRGDIKVWRL